MNIRQPFILMLIAASVSVATLDAQATRQSTRPSLAVPHLPLVFLDQKIEVNTVTGAPYSADVVSETIQTLSDGNRIVKRTTGTVARDAAGRVRREETRADGTVDISIHDPVARTVTTLDVARKTARVSPGIGRYTFKSFNGNVLLYSLSLDRLKSAPAGGRGVGAKSTPAASDDTVEESLPERTVEGVRVTGTRKTTTIPAGEVGNEKPIRVVTEEWTSPDLQVLVLTDFNDPRTVRTTYKLTNIRRDHPDASLFLVPEGYRTVRGASLPAIKR